MRTSWAEARDQFPLATMEEEEIVKSAQVISALLKILAALGIVALAVWLVLFALR
jgi:flagellar biogenesis protein FliO